MALVDRRKWNGRYERGDHASEEPSKILTSLAPLLPFSGRALDVAGGAGRNALWLAQHGLDVSLADISEVALAFAVQRAQQLNVSLTSLQVDLEEVPLPSGPWQMILSVQYLYRPLFDQFARQLAPGGTLVVIHPTDSNLQQNARPSKRFLLRDGELQKLVPQLAIVHYEEGWSLERRHDAVLVARRPQ